MAQATMFARGGRPRLLKIGGNASHALQLQAGWDRGATHMIRTTTLAAFLIARGPSAGLLLPPFDRPALPAPYAFADGIDPNADPGTPVGPGSVDGAKFSRAYTKADITLDCDAFTASIDFKN